ncbi:hypothetical protein PHMEG_00039849 [Phytophthora megakarya]|uniref:DUF6818 domain-containing protein n=1 Tax=Phytophthora megakarya TaxID=4795 RepID=A0A225UEY8_9STRA|nr:hypothetical protein PHMEG_00039849 [Phytophthora megakarya]
MWEQVAVQYNANRTRGSPERDFESLRRKFKSLYTKPKPTGSGEVPLRLKPVIWAKEIQLRIEEEGGVHTAHDGLDESEDDASLEETVDETTSRATTTVLPWMLARSSDLSFKSHSKTGRPETYQV